MNPLTRYLQRRRLLKEAEKLEAQMNAITAYFMDMAQNPPWDEDDRIASRYEALRYRDMKMKARNLREEASSLKIKE